MDFDIFFSISQTPANGIQPSEATMFRNFFEQVEAADRLGFGTAWIAESHLSTEVQKRNRHPVIPHWQGEVGLNADIFQLAHAVFRRTKRIEVGSAVIGLPLNSRAHPAPQTAARLPPTHAALPSGRRHPPVR